ncbi:hypothetical protein C2S51_033626 [Perilla frutescens var. frutescens]|nr:hypothetical protein C2S51_033626 [Perilla frutescens var. frutescens]
MSLSTFKTVACRISPVAGSNDSLSKVSNVTMMNRQAHPPLKVKAKDNSVLQECSSGTSRREMLQLTAGSVGLLSLMLPGSAEAGTRNASMRQKIMQKLEELRQKVGLSKPKDEGEEKKPKDEMKGQSKEEANPKAKEEGEAKKPKDEGETKAKVHNGVKESKADPKDGKNQTGKVEESKVAPSEGAVIPSLPGILNGKSVETILP